MITIDPHLFLSIHIYIYIYCLCSFHPRFIQVFLMRKTNQICLKFNRKTFLPFHLLLHASNIDICGLCGTDKPLKTILSCMCDHSVVSYFESIMMVPLITWQDKQPFSLVWSIITVFWSSHLILHQSPAHCTFLWLVKFNKIIRLVASRRC